MNVFVGNLCKRDLNKQNARANEEKEMLIFKLNLSLNLYSSYIEQTLRQVL